MIEFDEEDKKLYLDELYKDMDKYSNLDNTQLYNLILEKSKKIEDYEEKISWCNYQIMVLNTVLSVRLCKENSE